MCRYRIIVETYNELDVSYSDAESPESEGALAEQTTSRYRDEDLVSLHVGLTGAASDVFADALRDAFRNRARIHSQTQ